MMQRFHVGQVFTRQHIATLLGGNNRAFLPRIPKGDIVAGCFDPLMNPRAPYEVLVHNARNALAAAEQFLTQSAASAIPIFIRHAPNHWEYVGDHRATAYTEDPNEVAVRIYEIAPRLYERHARDYGGMRGILFLEEA